MNADRTAQAVWSGLDFGLDGCYMRVGFASWLSWVGLWTGCCISDMKSLFEQTKPISDKELGIMWLAAVFWKILGRGASRRAELAARSEKPFLFCILLHRACGIRFEGGLSILR